MARLTRDYLLRGIRRPLFPLPEVARRALFAGISSTDRLIRRRQLFTNIVAYVFAANAAVHFVTNAVHDFDGLLIVNIYNVAILVFALFIHRLHVLGDLVAAVTLITGLMVGHSFVVFAFGTSSDLHFYFTLAGFILFLVGVDHFRTFLALYGLGLVALLVGFFLAPENGFVLPGDMALRRALSFEAAMNAYVMNGLLIAIALTALHRAEERSEALLTTILPERIAERLKASRDRRIADRVTGCSVLFIDLVGFTEVTSRLEPEEVVAYLDGIFSQFDAACERLGVDKIKTIGDSYMAVAGLEGSAEAGARAIGLMALEIVHIIETAPELGPARLRMRGGIHCGPVTAGIIGDIRMSYDVWGDTVNIASRMESHGVPGRVHVSRAYRDLAEPWFEFEARGEIEVKSLGQRATYFLVGPKGETAREAPALSQVGTA